MSRIVIALGGNALGNTPQEQLERTALTAKEIISIIKMGHDVIVTHGNGPQVGMINLGFEVATNHNKNIPEIGFPECGAMSQGYIGFHLQNALQNQLYQEGINIPVTTLITQVEVSETDPAFSDPTKPIGSFYSEDEALLLHKEKGYIMKEDAGRGYRRVVPSPKPLKIIELDSILNLIEHKHLVISVGGGGIPVIRKGKLLVGVDAVIDKDFASAALAEAINADILLILTAVSHVMINFKLPNQTVLTKVSVSEIKKHLHNNEFARGSMLPKIEASLNFLNKQKTGIAMITELGKAKDALENHFGTIITN